jgi:hypothetical protein
VVSGNVAKGNRRLNDNSHWSLDFMNLKKFLSMRPSAPDTRVFLLMMNWPEEVLVDALKRGDITPEELEYCQGTIELIEGKRVAKTRKQWVDYLIGTARERRGKLMLGSPFRSYDSVRTKAKKLRKAMLQLESFNKAHPEATLDELVEKINADCRGRISIRRMAKYDRRTATGFPTAPF